jgi:hypothetical protein
VTDKKKKKSVPQRVINFFDEGAKWAKDVVRDEEVRASVRTDLGLPPEGPSKSSDLNVDNRFANIEAYRTTVNPDQEALSASIADLKAIYEAIAAVVKAGGESDDALSEQVLHQYLRLMSINFIRLRAPFLFWSGQLLGFIEQGFSTDTIPKPIGEAIVSFFKDPPAAIGQVYGSLETEEDARRISHGIFIPAGVLLGFLYKRTKYLPINKPAAISYGFIPSSDSVTPNGDRLSERAFSFLIKGSSNLITGSSDPKNGTPPDPCNPPDVPAPNKLLETDVSATFMMVPRQHFGRAGLFASFGGSGQLQLQLDDDWKLTLGPKSSGAIDFFFGEGGVDVGGPKDAAFSVSIEHLKKEEELPEIIPLTDKTRLEFGHLSFFAEGSLNGVKAIARARDCALVMASNNDAITERTVRTDQFRVDFDLGLGIADGHFFLEGGSGLEATLPGSKALGPLTVQALTVRLIPGGGPSKADFTFDVLATLQVKLGPLLITVQKIGLSAEIDFFDDFRFGFRRPEGLAILVNTDAVKGGGFLAHSPTTGEYFGALELTINESWSVKAIGVAGTRMPDGSRGFSFAAIITASGFRLNLGLGFQLTGVGGIIGLDRTFNLDKLEAKLKQGILRNLLFPPNPVANATAILADITQVFPPARDHYVMGLMFRFVWGSEKLVTIDLGVIISGHDHLTILGIVDVYFPLPKKALVEIHVHVMGDIDIRRKRIFVRAEIVNTSQIFGLTLKGSAAMLLTWGEDPVFILSFGGFNKRYEPQLPVGFPKLDRLLIQLADIKGLKVTLKAYLAVTSNSFQIGGSVDLKAGSGKFTIEGSLSVDALFQSSHPTFIFDLDASITLKAWGVTLFKVHVSGTLEGGHPWHARGSASFSIWIFDFSVDFDEEWGDKGGEQSLPPVDVSEQMIAALSDGRNWNAELPAEAEGLVTLQPSTSVSDGNAVLHPLSGLSITQRVAPLNITLSRVGNAKPKGQNRFTIERVSVSNAGLETDPIQEHFARSQFLDMTDDEKLGTPAFEKMDSGVRVGIARVLHGTPVTASMECETFVYRGKSGKTEKGAVKAVSEELLRRSLGIGAAASAPSAVRLRVPPPVVKVKSYKYVVVKVSDQSHVTAQPLNTYTEAVQAMRARVAAQPNEKTQLQVLEVTA